VSVTKPSKLSQLLILKTILVTESTLKTDLSPQEWQLQHNTDKEEKFFSSIMINTDLVKLIKL